MNYPDNVDIRAMERSVGIDSEDRRRVMEIAEDEYPEALHIARAIEALRLEVSGLIRQPSARIPNPYAGRANIPPTTWGDIHARLGDVADDLGVGDDELFELCRGRAGV